MEDYAEELRLIVAYSDAAMHYSAVAQRLHKARRSSTKYEYDKVDVGFESARIRCEEAKLALETFRAAKPYR